MISAASRRPRPNPAPIPPRRKIAPKPSSALRWIVSRGKMCFSSHSAAWGVMLSAVKRWRALADRELIVGELELSVAWRGALTGFAGWKRLVRKAGLADFC